MKFFHAVFGTENSTYTYTLGFYAEDTAHAIAYLRDSFKGCTIYGMEQW